MRFGLLGTGPWARRTYGPALAAHPGVELAGLFGVRAYDDPAALIADVGDARFGARVTEILAAAEAALR